MAGPAPGQNGRAAIELEARRRRARFRAWHRGMRELDLILGPFADAEIAAMAETEIDAFERLIESPDGDLYRWLVGDEGIPAEHDGEMSRRLKARSLAKAVDRAGPAPAS